jgi:hypothetical protein
MKINHLLFTACLVFSLNACNTPATNDQGGEQTAKDTGTTAVVAQPAVPAEAAYDPDPTDSIPGDQYGINSSSKQTADLVRLTLKDLLKVDLEKNLIDSFSRRFIFFEYDLNDDGKKEIFVGLTGPYFCGSGGCTQYILDNQGNVVTRFTVADYPVVIDNNKTNGWKDLFIYSGSKNRIAKFDEKKYPSNPSTLPALKVLPGDGLPRALDFSNEPYPWFTF